MVSTCSFRITILHLPALPFLKQRLIKGLENRSGVEFLAKLGIIRADGGIAFAEGHLTVGVILAVHTKRDDNFVTWRERERDEKFVASGEGLLKMIYDFVACGEGFL